MPPDRRKPGRWALQHLTWREPNALWPLFWFEEFMADELSLSAEFPEADEAQWQALAEKALQHEYDDDENDIEHEEAGDDLE